MFTRTQNFIGGMTFAVVGVGLLIAGILMKNAAMTGTGSTLMGLGLGWLGLQRPSDVA